MAGSLFIVLLLLLFLSGESTGYFRDHDRLLILSPQSGTGLMNQLTVISKALIVGNMMKRKVVISSFNIHYSRNIHVPLDEIINMSATKAALKEILPFTTLFATAAEPTICLHSRFPLDEKCSQAGAPGVEIAGGIADGVFHHAAAAAEAKLGVSAWLMYIWPGIESEMVQVLTRIRFNDVFFRARDRVLSALQRIVAQPQPSSALQIGGLSTDTGVRSSDFGVVHLRFEHDFLQYLHGMRAEQNESKVLNTAAVNDILLNRFIARVKLFVPPQSMSTLYICASAGSLIEKGMEALGKIYRVVFKGPKTDLFELQTSDAVHVALTGDTPPNGTRVITAASDAAVNSRELYALVDLLIALSAKRFMGVSGSSFSKCIGQMRRLCSHNVNSSAMWSPHLKLRNILKKQKVN